MNQVEGRGKMGSRVATKKERTYPTADAAKMIGIAASTLRALARSKAVKFKKRGEGRSCGLWFPMSEVKRLKEMYATS